MYSGLLAGGVCRTEGPGRAGRVPADRDLMAGMAELWGLGVLSAGMENRKRTAKAGSGSII